MKGLRRNKDKKIKKEVTKMKKEMIVVVSILALLLISAAATAKFVTQCNDGIDNDGDGFVDLADSGCSNWKDNQEFVQVRILPPFPFP